MTSPHSQNTLTGLGANHGYRFDGDFVHLHADVNFSDDDLNVGAAWSLQLWACDKGFSGNLPAGVKVAEQPIDPMPGGIVVAACCNAIPPAGDAAQVLAMALVATNNDGAIQVRELAVYPSAESFFQPRLLGAVACTLKDGSAELAIESIANPRAEGNLSGTLALEVWALDKPYAGGDWAGSPVASVIVGILGGANAWENCRYNVPAAMPAAGSALTIMLREWTPAGYVTRDYRNIAATLAPAAAAKAKPASKATPAAKPKAAAVAKPAVAAKAQVSINKAGESELAAIKGLSREVARAIVAGRPYASLDEVVKAKGMGAKMLAKLRDLLAL